MVNEVNRQLTSLRQLQGLTVIDEELLNKLVSGKLIDIDLLRN